ncbi:helix-turn-helix domain-containing protein [bacterium RCC_150]
MTIQTESIAPSVYTVKELAEILHIRPDTVLRYCREKRWPHRRFNQRTMRFTDEDLNTILEMTKAQPPQPTTPPRRRTRRPSL